MADPRDEERQREAAAALEGVRRDSEIIGTSSGARASAPPRSPTSAGRFIDHFAGRDAVGMAENGGTDPVEVWGRRIGRILSLIGVMILIYWLGSQLKLW